MYVLRYYYYRIFQSIHQHGMMKTVLKWIIGLTGYIARLIAIRGTDWASA